MVDESRQSIIDTVDVFSDEILMQGLLQKRGIKGLQMWKQRVFVLRGQMLYYYQVAGDQKGGKLKGTLCIKNGKASVMDSKYSHHFRLTLQDENNYRDFAAPTAQLMSDWIMALNTAAKAIVSAPATHLHAIDHERSTHVLLIRHGQYENVHVEGQDAIKGLTPLGFAQAEATGTHLSRLFRERMVDERFPKLTVFHSDLTRAKQTAHAIAQAFPGAEARENMLLREAWPCAPLPHLPQASSAEAKVMLADSSRLKVAFHSFFKHVDPKDYRRPSLKLPLDKVNLFEANYKNTSIRVRDRYRVIVCHANIIRWFVCTALGIDPTNVWGKMRYNHCGITEISVDMDGNMQLGYLNQTGHLASGQCTES